MTAPIAPLSGINIIFKLMFAIAAILYPINKSDVLLPPRATSSKLIETAGTNSLHQSEMYSTQNTVKVTKKTVHEFCVENRIERIHLLKSDTEGHDCEVIRGALPLLEEGRVSVFQFEYNHLWVESRHYLKDVFDIVKKLPYSVAKILPSRLEIYDTWHPELERYFEGNYVLVHKDANAWFNSVNIEVDRFNAFKVVTRG